MVAGILVPGPQFNIKMTSCRYRKSHCGDKTVVRLSYLHNGISYTGKMTSLHWIGALVFKIESLKIVKNTNDQSSNELQSLANMAGYLDCSPSNDCLKDSYFLFNWSPVVLHIEGILPIGPYRPCLSMAGRALLVGYHWYMHQWIGSALVQIMVCHLFDAKLWSELMVDYYQLDP